MLPVSLADNPPPRCHLRPQFFWAPTFKWGISIANVRDMKKPPETISLPQQSAVAATGLIWMRYSLVITPVNYNLFAVRSLSRSGNSLVCTSCVSVCGVAEPDSWLGPTLPRRSAGPLPPLRHRSTQPWR